MIFVTVGSQKFQFDRLLKKIDELIAQKVIKEQVFAQTGASVYKPKYYSYKDFLGRDEFQAQMSKCDILITHGGTGAIINAVKLGKKVIAVPRLAQYGEHVDNHQIQLIRQFDGMNLIMPCYEVDELRDKFELLETACFCPYQSNTEVIIGDIRKYLEG